MQMDIAFTILLVTLTLFSVESMHSVRFILHMISALTSLARPPSHAVLKHSLAAVIKVFPQVTQELWTVEQLEVIQQSQTNTDW